MSDTPQRTVTPQTGPDAGTKRTVHEQGLIDSLKGMMSAHNQPPGGTSQSGKQQSVDEAVDEAVNGTPGNSADY